MREYNEVNDEVDDEGVVEEEEEEEEKEMKEERFVAGQNRNENGLAR
jgi:hypothetical protein